MECSEVVWNALPWVDAHAWILLVLVGSYGVWYIRKYWY